MSQVTDELLVELAKLGATEAPLVLQMLRQTNTLEGEIARRQALVAALKAAEEVALGKLFPSD